MNVFDSVQGSAVAVMCGNQCEWVTKEVQSVQQPSIDLHVEDSKTCCVMMQDHAHIIAESQNVLKT